MFESTSLQGGFFVKKGGENMEKLSKFIPEQLKRQIDLKPRSVDELITIVERDQIQALNASVVTFSEFVASGMGGGWVSGNIRLGKGYEGVIYGTRRDGKNIRYKEYYGYLPDTEIGEEGEEIVDLMAMYSVNSRLNQIEDALPEVSTKLMNGERVVDRQSLDEAAGFYLSSLLPSRYSAL